MYFERFSPGALCLGRFAFWGARMQDQHARRLEQLERDASEARRLIERLTARLERLESQVGYPRLAHREAVTQTRERAARLSR